MYNRITNRYTTNNFFQKVNTLNFFRIGIGILSIDTNQNIFNALRMKKFTENCFIYKIVNNLVRINK